MGELRDREIAITAGTIRIASRSVATGANKPILRVSIKIEKTLQKEPNAAEVTIWNLSKGTRAALQKKGIPTEIEAGYFNATSLIFKGDLDYGSTTRQGSDWVTVLQATDSGTKYRSSRINISFDAGSVLTDVLKTAAEAIGVGLGNVAEAAAEGAPRGTALEYVKGLVLSGKASEQFDKIVKRAGWEWSIQDGQIQITKPGQPLDPDEVISLQQGTGLIGSPERGEKGIVKARSLLQPQLLPGHRVEIKAGDRGGKPEIDGFYRIEKLSITGDTGGKDWYSDIEARPL